MGDGGFGGGKPGGVAPPAPDRRRADRPQPRDRDQRIIGPVPLPQPNGMACGIALAFICSSDALSMAVTSQARASRSRRPSQNRAHPTAVFRIRSARRFGSRSRLWTATISVIDDSRARPSGSRCGQRASSGWARVWPPVARHRSGNDQAARAHRRYSARWASTVAIWRRLIARRSAI